MAEKCGKCDIDITKLKELLKGTECSANFHPKCNTRSVSLEGVNTRKTWKCDGSTAEHVSTNSKTGMDKDIERASGHDMRLS